VPASRELLFGKIAVTQGFCTQAQVDECLKLQLQMQSPHRPAPKLGQLLVDRGHLAAGKRDEVLRIQKDNLDLVDPLVKKRKEASIFGRVAVREMMATQDQVNECLRLQAQEGETRSLGEIMVAKNFLTEEQVKELLGKQLKRIMWCPACKLSFTVLSLSEGKKIDCPKCKGTLQEGKPTDSTRTDAEFATQVMRAVKAGIPAPVTAASAAPPRPSAKRIKAKCVICDHAFETALGPDGRVGCPSCHTTFTPKN
jgi:protein-arginine kinase activator protein McsA